MSNELHFAAGPYLVMTVPTSMGSCHKIGPLQKYDGTATFACIYADRMRPGIDDQCADAIMLRATAHLIAAAPDLYEAAQVAWNCIAELSPTQARVEVAQMLQAAIEKATGEKSHG